MTLVVAGIEGRSGWIVSDTLITGGTITLREREYQIKCLPAKDRRSLVAFSGDAHNGHKHIEMAAAMPSGIEVVETLRAAQENNICVDFIYMFEENDSMRLFKVLRGVASETKVAYIGEKSAFEQFQSIKHATEHNAAPLSFETFMFGSKGPRDLPSGVSLATISLLRLFFQRIERDVGGWVVPYVLLPEGAYICGYAHSVSDPILNKVSPGTIVPHGTAEEGGYGLSVTGLGESESMVVYFRQLPGGLILIRENHGYRTIQIKGEPNTFIQRALDILGEPIEVFFGDAQWIGLPRSITILRDEHGQPAVAIAQIGNNLSFSVLNVATAFTAGGKIDLASGREEFKSVTVQNLTFTLSLDRSHIKIQMLNDGKIVGESMLNPNDMDAVIEVMGRCRSGMEMQVALEPDQSKGHQELCGVNPAWRTDRSPHAAIDGIILRLRHIGLGWVSFILPRPESRALGKWLTDNSPPPDGHHQPPLTKKG